MSDQWPGDDREEDVVEPDEEDAEVHVHEHADDGIEIPEDVELLEGEVRVHARLRTARLPRELVGPLAAVLQPNEPVEATGPLRVTGPRTGEWAVRSLQIRDFPVPASAVRRLISRAVGDSTRTTVPWTEPAGVRGGRVHRTGVTLYGASSS
jgi:hypothetical protein